MIVNSWASHYSSKSFIKLIIWWLKRVHTAPQTHFRNSFCPSAFGACAGGISQWSAHPPLFLSDILTPFLSPKAKCLSTSDPSSQEWVRVRPHRCSSWHRDASSQTTSIYMISFEPSVALPRVKDTEYLMNHMQNTVLSEHTFSFI